MTHSLRAARVHRGVGICAVCVRAACCPAGRKLRAIAANADEAWTELCAYDTTVFGNDRSQILRAYAWPLPRPICRSAWRADRRDAAWRDGRTASHLGPLIAEDDEVAKALLARALNGIGGAVYIDIADAKPDVRTFLEAAGFSVQRPFTRMLLGRDRSFDDAGRTYAVIGPEFG